MYSQIERMKFMNSEKSWIDTSSFFKAQVIGKLLGDGCLTKQEGRKPRFQFIHSAKDYEWNIHCFHSLKTYLPLNPPRLRKIKDVRLRKRYSLSHYTQSKTSSLVTFLRNTWYQDNKKLIPFDMLYKYFTVESLAWWYMDDGHFKQKNGVPLKIILSTDNFSRLENKQLIKFLSSKFYLSFRLDNQNRIILYDQYQIHYFFHLITPFTHVSMHRKMPNRFNHSFDIKAKRTTLYLPKQLEIKKPTKEINEMLVKLENLIKIYKSGLFYEKYISKIQQLQIEPKPYQIVVSQSNLKRLYFLNNVTGLSLSGITELSFQENLSHPRF